MNGKKQSCLTINNENKLYMFSVAIFPEIPDGSGEMSEDDVNDVTTGMSLTAADDTDIASMSTVPITINEMNVTTQTHEEVNVSTQSSEEVNVITQSWDEDSVTTQAWKEVNVTTQAWKEVNVTTQAWKEVNVTTQAWETNTTSVPDILQRKHDTDSDSSLMKSNITGNFVLL